MSSSAGLGMFKGFLLSPSAVKDIPAPYTQRLQGTGGPNITHSLTTTPPYSDLFVFYHVQQPGGSTFMLTNAVHMQHTDACIA